MSLRQRRPKGSVRLLGIGGSGPSDRGCLVARLDSDLTLPGWPSTPSSATGPPVIRTRRRRSHSLRCHPNVLPSLMASLYWVVHYSKRRFRIRRRQPLCRGQPPRQEERAVVRSLRERLECDRSRASCSIPPRSWLREGLRPVRLEGWRVSRNALRCRNGFEMRSHRQWMAESRRRDVGAVRSAPD
jgi:hypothetical protein